MNERNLENQIKDLQNEVLRLQAELQVLRANEFDSVTGAYIREAFIRYASDKLKSDSGSYDLVMSDIEHYKYVISKYGIERVNEILKEIASYLLSLSHRAVVGRYSADRFVILIPHEDFIMAKRMQKEGLAVFDLLKDAEIQVKFGIVLNVNHEEEVTKICDHAFTSLRIIKHRYGEVVKYYDESVEKRIHEELLVEEHMQRALTEHQFSIYYQPKTDVKTGKIGGAEALVRWIHPTLGFMNPGVFIPVFERNGFISLLDYYIWEEVCQMLSSRLKEKKPVVPISINVSRKDFDYFNLSEKLTELVDSYEIPHELIHIEVTESSYAERPERISLNINSLHEKGFMIELDDFGSGYTSLSSLNDMKLDVLKVDMSLLEKDDLQSQRSVLSFAFQLAKMMNLKTVQEGVETEEQSERIRDLDGDYIQGYYYSKPLPRVEFEAYIDEHI